MKITIIGTGYVGLVSGACFADLGFDVTCVDKDENKIQNLKKLIFPFYEPNLFELLHKNIKEGRLHFTSLLRNTISASKVIIIAVGTPCDLETGRANLKDLYAVLDCIAPHLDENKLIVLKSTVPMGTLKRVQEYLCMLNPHIDIEVASNPEFLREGNAVHDFMQPDRIIIGTESLKARAILRRLYHIFLSKNVPYIETSPQTSELIKYASNAFLGMKVSFINQMADLCEKSNGNVREVAQALGFDHRIGKEFLNPGPGFGGSCFPKDLRELSLFAKKFEVPLTLVDQVLEFNNLRPTQMVKVIQKAFEDNLIGKTLAILGLTFKANTDDLRDSPSLNIINQLYHLSVKLQVYDPKGMDSAKKILPMLSFAKNPYEAIKNADGLIILTEWQEFKDLDLKRIKQLLKTPLIIDLRNIFSLDEMKSKGFTYYSLGHSPLNEKTKTTQQDAA